jgi:DNA-binding MarR family transcriptional regulator
MTNLHSRDFIYTCPAKVLDDNSLSLNDLKIYMKIRSFMDTTGEAYPSNSWFAKSLNIDSRSVRRCITKLVSKGYIERFTRDEKRYLRVKQTPIIEETTSTPPSDTDLVTRS